MKALATRFVISAWDIQASLPQEFKPTIINITKHPFCTDICSLSAQQGVLFYFWVLLFAKMPLFTELEQKLGLSLHYYLCYNIIYKKTFANRKGRCV